MDMNDSFDKTVRREGAAGLRSFSWAGRELRFCGERTTLHVAGVSYDMEPVLDALRHAGVRVRGISPARWISLLRGCPTVLPGCDRMFVIAGTPSGYTAGFLEPARGGGNPSGNKKHISYYT